MSIIRQLINNQVSELFALICFLVGAGIGYIMKRDG